jgi:glycosyltransferase involved in cell wall biosynthesis
LTYTDVHRDALLCLSQARVLIGLSISDGLPTTVLEAMALGVFPIQSSTSCVKEWVENGKTALVVSPHDTREVADAVVRAISDDSLVDSAAETNLRTVRERWSLAANGARVWEIYERLTG